MTVICMLRQVFDELGGTGIGAQAETFYAANHIKMKLIARLVRRQRAKFIAQYFN